MKKINIKAFTFVELIVVMVIIAILGTIGFYSYIGYISDSRDSQRKSDLSKVSSALKIYKQKRGYYAIPGTNFNITYSGTIVAIQGRLNTFVRLNSLDSLPFDPKINKPYIFSVSKNKQEFELSATLENEKNDLAIVEGNYKSVSKNILPTILVATGAVSGTNIEIQSGSLLGDINKNLFIYNLQDHNLGYTFTDGFESFTDGISFTGLLDEVENNNTYWQNTDFRNCTEIKEAGKLILPLSASPFEYQIITDTGALINTGCTL